MSAATPYILTQKPREYTVQVVDLRDLRILGSGVVVTDTGLVVTCQHVADACATGSGDGSYEGLGVRFPQTDTRPTSTHPAEPVGDLNGFADDFLCLQVVDPPSLKAEHVAVVGSAEGSEQHRFTSYGYRRLAEYIAGRADGTILGPVEAPAGKPLRCEPVQLVSQHIDHGMSGAGVLDIQRNLVVGLIAQTWDSAGAAVDRDTAFAVNARVVEFTGLPIPVAHESHPLAPVEPPKFSRALKVRGTPAIDLAQAPPPLAEWVGRGGLIGELRAAWKQPDCLVIGLVGFGGEGKTSVARRVVDALVDESDCTDVFWWTFTEAAGPDAFFSAALEYTVNKTIAQFISPEERPEALASTLAEKRYLFVLDALEIYQEQEGDGYGTLTDQGLRRFLEFFATPGHGSMCLVTSRAPVFDLQPYVTYRHVDVNALSPAAARMLLRKIGISGSEAELDRICLDWGYHALTLTLLAGYLVRRFGGDARRQSSLPTPDPNETHDARVARVLREYDRWLSADEKAFLTAFSVYRTAVPPEALAPALAARDTAPHTRRSVTDILEHLLASRIIHSDATVTSVMHPLIRDHYSRLGSPQLRAELHRFAKSHYAHGMEAIPDNPSLEDLTPAIEAAHHACMSGSFEEAADIILDRLYQGTRGLITRELNAYSTVLTALLDFFPGQALRTIPHGEPDTRSWVYHETATALQMLGRADEAAQLMRRALDDLAAREKWHDAAVSCQNLTELYLERGSFPTVRTLLTRAFDLARRAEDPEDELVAHTLAGGLAHMQGDTEAAAQAFAESLRLAREHTPLPILYSTSGIHYADHLRRSGDADAARSVHLNNLKVCTRAGWKADEARCHIGLGDLARDAGDMAVARQEYEAAYSIARLITRRDTLIHATLARARVLEDPVTARSELDKALSLATKSGYRLLEADIKNAIAQVLRDVDSEQAWEAATVAGQLSAELGYHWGRADSDGIIASLG